MEIRSLKPTNDAHIIILNTLRKGQPPHAALLKGKSPC